MKERVKTQNLCLSVVGRQSNNLPETILLLEEKTWPLGQFMMCTAGAGAVSTSPPHPQILQLLSSTPEETFQSVFATIH